MLVSPVHDIQISKYLSPTFFSLFEKNARVSKMIQKRIHIITKKSFFSLIILTGYSLAQICR